MEGVSEEVLAFARECLNRPDSRQFGMEHPRAAGVAACHAHYAKLECFERSVGYFDATKVNEQITAAFVAALDKRVNEENAAGKIDFRTRFEELRGIFCRSDARVPDGATRLRTQWIGQLRRLLAIALSVQ